MKTESKAVLSLAIMQLRNMRKDISNGLPADIDMINSIAKGIESVIENEKQELTIEANIAYNGSAMACPHRLQDSCTLRTVAGCYDETCDINARNIRK